MKLILIIFSIVTNLAPNAVSTEKLVYNLIVSGVTIGKVTAIKKVEGDKTTYTSDTDATVSMVFKIDIKTRMIVEYKNNILQSSSYKLYKNDNLKEEATVTLSNGVYTMTHNNKVTTYNKKIIKSTIVLPFEKPSANDIYFEEVEGTFKTMKLITDNKYQLFDQKNNKKDDYNYNDNYLQSSIVRNAFVDFKIVLKAY